MCRNRSRFSRTTLFGCALLLTAGCPLVVVPAAILAGFFAGRMGVTFTPGSTSAALSDGEGQARVEFRENEDGSSRFESYEGILPGFVEMGATMGVVELRDGTVSGVVTTPDGEDIKLSDILPGLRAERQENDTGFDLVFQDGGAEYTYSMTLDMELEESGSKLDGTVSIHRLVLQDGNIVLDDSGEGTIETEREQDSGNTRPLPLDPLPPPIIIDAGPATTIEIGGSTILEATARGGSDLTVAWSPSVGLDDAEVLQPIASPETTTTYTLTVTDSAGQRAIDVVDVTVVEASPEDALIVTVGPDATIRLGEAISLQARVSGGDGDYRFRWQPTTGLSDPNALAPSASPEETTTYALIVVDGMGAIGTGSMTVFVDGPEDEPMECLVNAECDDDDPVTEDRCVAGACVHSVLEPIGPCASDTDCNDGNPLTLDRCKDGVCTNEIPVDPFLECEIIDADITAPTTLTAGCYLVERNIAVRNDATLKIEPGVTLIFSENTGMLVQDGTLQAEGASDNFILFTGAEKIRGFWNGLRFFSSPRVTNRLEYVRIEYGGGFDFSNGPEPIQGNLMIHRSSRVAALTNCVLRESDAFGLVVGPDSIVDTFASNTITANRLGAANMGANAAGILDTASSYTGNDVDVVLLAGSNVTRDQTWRAIGVDYLVGTRFTDNFTAALTIEPGVRLVFKDEGLMSIRGSLTAVGTAENPIVFTAATKARGSWEGVQFRNNSVNNRLDFVTIEYGGGTGIFPNIRGNVVLESFGSGGPPRASITNCTLRDSDGYGFWFSVDADVSTFTNNAITGNRLGAGRITTSLANILDETSTFVGNDLDFVLVDPASFTGTSPRTWAAIDVPHLISGTVFVNIPLTISPGATLVFQDGAGMRVANNGALTAVGTSGNEIVFTGEQEVKGFWDGLEFLNASAGNRLEFAIIEFGGASQGNITLDSTGLAPGVTVKNCVIRESLNYGIWVERRAIINADVDTANTFSGNAAGKVFREP